VDIRPLSHWGGRRHLKANPKISLKRKDLMMPEHQKPKNIACGDVVPGCTFTASADTEEELVKKVIAHAAHEHGVSEITPELAAKVQAAIKSQ